MYKERQAEWKRCSSRDRQKVRDVLYKERQTERNRCTKRDSKWKIYQERQAQRKRCARSARSDRQRGRDDVQ